jgi:hypothetical protein
VSLSIDTSSKGAPAIRAGTKGRGLIKPRAVRRASSAKRLEKSPWPTLPRSRWIPTWLNIGASITASGCKRASLSLGNQHYTSIVPMMMNPRDIAGFQSFRHLENRTVL